MNTMTHKGFTARIEYDERDRIFVGRILGIRDIVSFHGTSVDEVEAALHDAVDDYLAACKQLGQTPNKAASGNLMLRVPPDVHLQAQIAAQAHGQSLNQWATDVLRHAAAG